MAGQRVGLEDFSPTVENYLVYDDLFLQTAEAIGNTTDPGRLEALWAKARETYAGSFGINPALISEAEVAKEIVGAQKYLENPRRAARIALHNLQGLQS
jgi:hypothetical protein